MVALKGDAVSRQGNKNKTIQPVEWQGLRVDGKNGENENEGLNEQRKRERERQKERERKEEDKGVAETNAPPPFTSELRASGLDSRGKRWKRFVEMPWNWISQGLFCQGFPTGVVG